MNNNHQELKDNPKILTLSAIILGYALIGDYNASEQNSIGNWFQLVGQILETNSAFLQNMNNNNNSNSSGPTIFNNHDIFNTRLNKDEAEIAKIKEVLENLINKINNL